MSYKTIEISLITLTIILTIISCQHSGEPERLLKYENPTVADVPAAFYAIDTSGSKLAVWTNGMIDYPFYSINPLHDFKRNTFRGIQRLNRSKYLVICGSNPADQGDLREYGLKGPGEWGEMPAPHGNLFIAHLASSPDSGALRTNVGGPDDRPRLQDKLISKIDLMEGADDGAVLWHPGRISLCGDILVVPLENNTSRLGKIQSRILFYDLSDPAKPRRMQQAIERSGEFSAAGTSAAAMVRLRDGRFLVAANTAKQTDFYLSKADKPEAGFYSSPSVIFEQKQIKALKGITPGRYGETTFQFVKQTDGRLYAISFRGLKFPGEDGNKKSEGRHALYLFRFDFPGDDYTKEPVVTKVGERYFGGINLNPPGWGHFAAAAGIYITPQGRLAIYSSPHWIIARTDVPADKEEPYIQAGDAAVVQIAEFWHLAI